MDCTCGENVVTFLIVSHYVQPECCIMSAEKLLHYLWLDFGSKP